MKNVTKKLLCIGMAAALSISALAGCGSSDAGGESAPAEESAEKESASGQEDKEAAESAQAEEVKIGVLVADVSGEEALAFRSYYENYIAGQYNVLFSYTEELKDAAAEKSAIEKFAAQGYQAVISLSSSDRALQIKTCEENEIYYAVASGMLDDDQYEQFKGSQYFAGQIGPSMETEYEAGFAMGQYFAEKGVKTVAIYGAFIPNPMHVYRTAGVLAGLGLTYGGASDEGGIVGQIFGDQAVDLSKVDGDIQVVSYLQGYGDTTTDEINAAIQADPEAFISVGMATTFFTQQLNGAGIEFSDIDSFTESNGQAIKEGKLVYLAGKYSSSIGPVFALVYNAVNGNVIRDNDGNAVSISQGYLVATDAESFDSYYVTDNGEDPIYNKAVLDTIIGDGVTYEDLFSLVQSH